jgi:DNA-binding NtrC family response regulator
VNVRVIAATNKDPQRAVASGELRGDLFYRLNVFNIQMPSLRDHREDIPAMALAMVEEMNTRHSATVPGITRSVLERFADYSWPGNARELRNTIERAVILANDRQLDISHLPSGFGDESAMPMSGSPVMNGGVQTGMQSSPPPMPGGEDMVHLSVGTTVDEAEKQLILKTLNATRNNKTRAAEILGISSKTLQNKLKEYALEDRDPS